MSHFVAYILQFQEIIVYKIPPGGGRGSITSLRSKSWRMYLLQLSRRYSATRRAPLEIRSLFCAIYTWNECLTYGPRLQRYKWHWQLNMHKLFTEQVRSPYTEQAASGLPNHTHLEGEVRFDQAQNQQVVTTCSARIVTECLHTRSMLIKMYVYAVYSRFRIGTILSIRKHGCEFISTLSLSSLMSHFES